MEFERDNLIIIALVEDLQMRPDYETIITIIKMQTSNQYWCTSYHSTVHYI